MSTEGWNENETTQGIYLTIIPRARVGYELIDNQRGT